MKRSYYVLIFSLVTFVLSLFTNEKAHSSHLRGGEVTWKCVMDGGKSKYKFKVVVYRLCTGCLGCLGDEDVLRVSNLNGTLNPTLNNAVLGGDPIVDPTSGNIKLVRTSKKDISPSCGFPTVNPLFCDPNSSSNSDAGSVEKHTYESGLIDFTGVNPPVNVNNPVIFSFEQCCRDGATNLTSTIGNGSMVLYSKMYPFYPNGQTTAQSIQECFDNAPDFTEPPSALLYTSGLDFIFNNNATDVDLDNLYYDFDVPIASSESDGSPVIPLPEEAFLEPYTMTNPFALGSDQYSFDNFTGEFKFKPLSPGQYVSVIRVASYKCDQKVSEIFRDFKVGILIPDSTQNSNRFPTFKEPFKTTSGTPTSIYRIIAGQKLLIPIVVRDSLPGNNNGISPQEVELSINGIAMGEENADTLLGCPFPPCAMMTRSKTNYTYNLTNNPKPVAIQNVPGELFGYGFDLGAAYGTGATQTDTVWVYWPTSCSNLDRADDCNGLTSSRYNFTVSTKDDFCRVPGKTIRTFSVIVLPPDFYLSPPIRCITYDYFSNSVNFKWGISPGDTNTFVRYEIYRGNTMLFSTTNRNIYEYTDNTPGASPDSTYYVRSVNLCGINDDVYPAKPIKMNANFYRSNQARLTWNAIRTPALSSTRGYRVYRSETIAPYNWVAITDGDGDTTNTEAIDNFNLCGDTTYYKVEGLDSLGCVSESNIDTVSHPQLFARFHTDTVCQGIPTTFTLDTLYGGIPPYTTVRWLGEEGFSAGNVDSAGYVYPTHGTKRYTFTVIDSKGCRLDILDSAIVRELPNFEVMVDSSCGPVINNFSVTVNSLAPIKTIRYQGDNGQLDLQGDFNDPLFRNLKWIFLTNGGRGQFKVAVTLTDTFGCVTTDTAIVENGDPYVDILVDSTACQSPKDTLSIMPYFLTRPFNNVQWIDVTNPSSPTILQSITERLPLAKVAGKRFVKLKVLIEDGKGCSGEGYVSFNLSPAVEFKPDSLCIGDPVNFDLDIASGSDTNNFTFLWELDANTVSTDRRPVHTYMSNGPKVVSLTVTDTINGCVTLIKDTLTVRNPMEFTIQVTPDCAGLPTVFSPVVISGDDTAWVWTINEYPDVRPNNTISISGIRSPSVILDAGSGFFKVSLSMNDRVSGCWTTIDTVIKVFNQPDIDFDVDSINCAGQVTQFISKVVGDSGPYTYSWIGDDNFSDTVANPTHVYPNDATEYYNVTFTVTNRFGCVVSKTKQVRVCDDKRTLVQVPQIFSPGRERNNTLSVHYNNVDDFEITIYNRWGIEVFSSKDPDFVWDGKDPSGEYLMSGTYVYIVKANGLGKRNYLTNGTIVVLR